MSSIAIAGGAGGRTLLIANTSYFVSTTGSDSNSGSNASPFATLQHALFVVANTLDIKGFIVFINIGAGTFVGAGVASTVGGGIVQINGAGSASTILQDGPNDGTYNDGSILSMLVLCGSVVALNAVTLKSPTGGNFLLEPVNNGNFVLGDGTLATSTGDIIFDSSAASSDGQVGIFISATVNTSGGSYAIKGTNWNSAGVIGQPVFGFATCQFGNFTPRGTWTISNSPTMNFIGAEQNSWVNLGLLTVTGAFTGSYARSYLNSVVREANSPSSSNGVFADSSSSLSFLSEGGIDGLPGPLPGINTQTGTPYTLAISDAFEIVEMNLAGANTVTVPLNATVAFTIGTKIWVTQIGAGATTIAGAVGVTVDNAGVVGGQWKSVKLYKRGTDEWVQTNA